MDDISRAELIRRLRATLRDAASWDEVFCSVALLVAAIRELEAIEGNE